MGIDSIGTSNIYASAMSSMYSSLYSTSSTSSSSSALSFSSTLDSFQISSEARDLASRPAPPPDFDSMSSDEFREHVTEMQDILTEQGFDVSNIADMTDEELDALKSEMVEKGAEFQQGPPPPPPQQDALTSAYEASSIDLQSWMYNALNQTFM